MEIIIIPAICDIKGKRPLLNIWTKDIHTDKDDRGVTVLTDDERPLVFYDKAENKQKLKFLVIDNTNGADQELNTLLPPIFNEIESLSILVDELNVNLEKFHNNVIVANFYETYNFLIKEIEKPISKKNLAENYTKILKLMSPIFS